MNFVEILKISGITAILSGVVGAMFNSWLATRKERAVRAEGLKYQALRVALALERFSIRCAEVISDVSAYEASNGAFGGKSTTMPMLALPENTEWKYFKLATTNKILSFQNVISNAASSIAFELSIANHHQDTDEAEVQAGLCGYMAHMMAVELREMYGLGRKEEPVHGWDYVTTIKKYHDLKMAVYDKLRIESSVV